MRPSRVWCAQSVEHRLVVLLDRCSCQSTLIDYCLSLRKKTRSLCSFNTNIEHFFFLFWTAQPLSFFYKSEQTQFDWSKSNRHFRHHSTRWASSLILNASVLVPNPLPVLRSWAFKLGNLLLKFPFCRSIYLVYLRLHHNILSSYASLFSIIPLTYSEMWNGCTILLEAPTPAGAFVAVCKTNILFNRNQNIIFPSLSPREHPIHCLPMGRLVCLLHYLQRKCECLSYSVTISSNGLPYLNVNLWAI